MKIEIIEPTNSGSNEGYYIDGEGAIFYVNWEGKITLAHATKYGPGYVSVGGETYLSPHDLKEYHVKLPDSTKEHITYEMVEGVIHSTYSPQIESQVESHVGLYRHEDGDIYLFLDLHDRNSGVCVKAASAYVGRTSTMLRCTDEVWTKLPTGTQLIITV